MNINPNSQYYQDVLKELYWKLDDRIPDKKEYKELKVLLNNISGTNTYNWLLGLGGICLYNNLFEAYKFIEKCKSPDHSLDVAYILSVPPRILWLEHYISNYENRSLWYKIKLFFKS